MKYDARLLLPSNVHEFFPRLADDLLERNEFLNLIESEGSRHLFTVVKGDEGVGKTTLLAQFASYRNPETSICIFLKKPQIYAHFIKDLLQDLCNQLEVIISHQELDEHVLRSYSEDDYLSLFRQQIVIIKQKIRKTKYIYYFIIDGLHHYVNVNNALIERIFDIFSPCFSQEGFRFLISGDAKHLGLHKLNLDFEEVRLVDFSSNDAKLFLDSTGLDSEQISYIYKTCKGSPRHLANFKRILMQDKNKSDNLSFVDNILTASLTELFELRWAKTENSEIQNFLLAIIAFDDRLHSLTELSEMIEIDRESTAKLLDLDFITISDISELVDFESDVFRRFAISKVPYTKTDVLNKIIAHLAEHPQYKLSLLPQLFSQTNRLPELTKYLSNEFFDRALEYRQSISFLIQMTDLGVNAANHLRDDSDIFRFNLQKSLLLELLKSEVLVVEIEALMELNHYDEALSLASNAPLKEDQIQLLAVIARKKIEQGLEPEAELIQQISYLFEKVELSSLGNEKAFAIALVLLHSSPDLAIKLLETAFAEERDSKSLDFAFAGLSFAALSKEDSDKKADIIQNIKGKITDPKAQQFAAEFSAVFGKYNAEQIISEVSQIKDVEYQIKLLSLWIVENRKSVEVLQVVEYTFNLAIRTPDYTSSARIFRQISTGLVHNHNNDKTLELVKRFDSQNELIANLGPSHELIRLQINLANAEVYFDIEKAIHRIKSSVEFTHSKIIDLSVQCECLGQILSCVIKLNAKLELIELTNLAESLENQLWESYRKLLDSTAEHYASTKGIIAALARRKPNMAVDFCLLLNVLPRKDKALFDFISKLSEYPLKEIDFGTLELALMYISNPDLAGDALLPFIDRLYEEEQITEEVLESCLSVISRIHKIPDIANRANALAKLMCILIKNNLQNQSELLLNTQDQLFKVWKAIDESWVRIEVGFEIIQITAKFAKEFSEKLLTEIMAQKRKTSLCNPVAAKAFIHSIRLAIRSFRGLVNNNLNTDEEFENLKHAIEIIPSCGERAVLWSELALCYFISKNTDKGKYIVNNFVIKDYENIDSDNLFYKWMTTIQIAPAIYKTHEARAIRYIDNLPSQYKDQAYYAVFDYIVHKQFIVDPYDSWGEKIDLELDEIDSILHFSDKFDNDFFIHLVISVICKALKSNEGRAKLTRRHVADIQQRLDDLINNKFPAKDYIQHDGFKIVAQAELLSLKSNSTIPDWKNLTNEAKKIPNISDMALVMCSIAEALPNRESKFREQTLKESFEIVKKIPSLLDRSQRLVMVATATKYLFPKLAREAIDLAWKTAASTENPDIVSTQRSIIDFIEGIFPDLTDTLINTMDDDPARKKTEEIAKRQREIIELKKKIFSSTNEENQTEPSIEYLEAAADKLASLNAGRSFSAHMSEAIKCLRFASKLPLQSSYVLFMLYIQNAVIRFSNDRPSSNQYLKPIFNCTITLTQIIEKLSGYSVNQIEKTRSIARSMWMNNSAITIGIDEKSKALEYFEDWIRENVVDYLKICDPYLGPNELIEILSIVMRCNPTIRLSILTSKKHHENNASSNWRENYRNEWNKRYDEDPPTTTVIIAGRKSNGSLPVHDRYCITRNSGLNFGTSFSGLGKKDTSIIRLSEEHANELEKTFDSYSPLSNTDDDNLDFDIFRL